jgi:hypothetical protein
MNTEHVVAPRDEAEGFVANHWRGYYRTVRTALHLLALWSLTLSGFGAEKQLADWRTAGRYRVSVTCAELDARRDALGRDQYHHTLHGGILHGTDGGIPRTVVRSVSVFVGTQRYSVPPELYRDLADPNLGPTFHRGTFTVAETWRYVIVTISGGDGAGSYNCRFRISKSRLDIARSVQSHPMTDFPPYEPLQKLIPLRP